MKLLPALVLCGGLAAGVAVGDDVSLVKPGLPVGRLGSNLFITTASQLLTPAGRNVVFPEMRPQVAVLAPDGSFLAVSGKTSDLLLLDPVTGDVKQTIALPAEAALGAVSQQILKPDKDAQVSFTGLVFSRPGAGALRLYLSSVNGRIKIFGPGPDGKWISLGGFGLPLANAPGRKEEIPAGLAVSEDGKKLYVAGNLSNRLLELDAADGKLLRSWDVGVAPYDVVLTGGRAFVSNWGGRRPGAGDLTGPAGRGTRVRVDPVRHIASEGSVSIVSLEGGAAVREVHTGLHASALAVSPDQRHVVVANAGSDTLSVLDVKKGEVVETIWVRQHPTDSFGASPNALVFDPQGKTLYVCNGTQNAVAVVRFKPGKSELEGLIPVGWFPGAIAFDAKRQSLCVANIKGIGSGSTVAPGDKVKFNSHQHQGSVSIVPVPSRAALKEHTRVALRNMHYPRLKAAALKPRAGQPARPVPERAGEPSVFKHVVYFVKENRTYDQVLGDVPAGNGDPTLCIFGDRITPNQHKLVREFTLLDNTYCCGVLSADGHQWSTTAFATDYMEKSFAGFPRSYPDGMEDDDVDALAYSPGGFIWDNVLRHGKTLRDYGEFAITDKQWKDPDRKGGIHFLDHWRDWTNGTPLVQVSSRPAVASLGPYLATNTVGWDMDIPDVFRAAEFIKELREFERKGEFPNLVIICLPNDHTSGTSPGAPTPAAQVADNDLAFGQIIEAISHSKFWKETCILSIEDDPQAGWDHVSGYRTTAYVASPYTKRGKVVSTQYSHTSLLRTIELILGLPPMNQLDATATPMTDCFTDVPDFTPFTAVANNVPLDQMNPPAKVVKEAMLRQDAKLSARLELGRPDACPEDVLNRILWRAMKGVDAPYPEWAVARVRDED